MLGCRLALLWCAVIAGGSLAFLRRPLLLRRGQPRAYPFDEGEELVRFKEADMKHFAFLLSNISTALDSGDVVAGVAAATRELDFCLSRNLPR